MARHFTRRISGEMMTTFRVRIDLSQAMIGDLVARAEKLYGEQWKIERILEGCLTSGMERLWLDPMLDPDKEA